MAASQGVLEESGREDVTGTEKLAELAEFASWRINVSRGNRLELGGD